MTPAPSKAPIAPKPPNQDASSYSQREKTDLVIEAGNSSELPNPNTNSDFQASLEQLSRTAASLNRETDRLARLIETLDVALRKLNLGVSASVRVSYLENPSGSYVVEDLAYAKVGGKWGLAIISGKGHDSFEGSESTTEWLFADAPREIRVRAVEFIPKLIVELNKTASDMVNRLSAKTKEAEDLALAINKTVLGVNL